MLKESSNNKQATTELPEPKEVSEKKISTEPPVLATQEKKKEKTKTKAPEIISSTSGSSLQELLEKNIKWSQAIYEQNKKIKRKLNTMLLGSYLKLLLIIIPLVFAVIYLPPLLEQVLGQYNQLLGGSGGVLNIQDLIGQSLNFNDILKNVSPEDIEGAMKILPQK